METQGIAEVTVVVILPKMSMQIFIIHITDITKLAQGMASMGCVVRVTSLSMTNKISSRIVLSFLGKHLEILDTEIAEKEFMFPSKMSIELFKSSKLEDWRCS